MSVRDIAALSIKRAKRIEELEAALRKAERSLEVMVQEYKGAWSEDREALAAVKAALGDAEGEAKDDR